MKRTRSNRIKIMANTRYRDTEYTSQKSTRFYVAGDKKRKDLQPAMYTHMFIEDLHLGIMPIGWQPERYKFQCMLEPSSDEVEKLIISALPTRHGTPYYFTESICDFVEEATHIISYHGKVHYEIVCVYENDKKDKIKGFQLINISNNNIRNALGFYWQCIPKEVMEDRKRERSFISRDAKDKEEDKRLIWLPRKSIFSLDFPRQLGGKKQLKSILSGLRWASQETVPKFYMKDMEVQKQPKGYDFSTYRDNQDIFVLKLTRRIGWPARSLSSDKLLEFYTLYRYLKFAHTQAILREYIIKRFNSLLCTVGKKIGFKAKIIISNCISSEQLDRSIKDLSEGKLEFSEIVKLTRIS